FVQMFGNVVRGIKGERFEEEIKRVKKERDVKDDTDLDVEDLKALTQRFKELFRDETGEDFPQDPHEQLRQAIRAVFDSWTGDRAVTYRRIHRIPDSWGTAVNVQQMVFGNNAASLDALLHPSFAADQEFRVLASGVAASPGAA